MSQVVGLLGAAGSDNLAAWTKGLGAVGAFGEALPFVTASPGGLAGLDTLIADGVLPSLTGEQTWAGLSGTRDVTLPGGGKGTLDVAVDDLGEGKRVHVDLAVRRTVTKQAFVVSSESPKVELAAPEGITAEVETTASLWVVWTGEATNRVYLASDNAHAPRVDVKVDATLSAAVKGALGILDISLSSADFTVRSHAYATISDPNNDGILSFDQAGGAELAAEGSLAGLVSASLDPSSPGSVRGSITVAGDVSGLPGLPVQDLSATVGIDWPKISEGTPTITAPSFSGIVGKFQNLTLRDLADGLAQVSTMLTGIQKARFDPDGSGPLQATGNLDLPFMRGTVADALKVNEVLVAFLRDNVIQAPDPNTTPPKGFDPTTIGNPKFTSLQDLIGRLKAMGIGVDNLAWDAATSKLAFHLTMTKAAAGKVPMDPGAARVSKPGASYAPSGLTLTDGTKPWAAGELVGMRVIAGTSAGEITANTADSITLAGPWIGGPPSDSTPFVIQGPEAQVGAVTFADSLTDGPATQPRGILRANSAQTFAQVAPSFTVNLTLVLDLQDPKTGAECVGFEGNTKPCISDPYVESLPHGADRVMLRTGAPLLTANFPIDTKVDLVANAGFFQVHLTGALKACNTTAPADCSSPGTGDMLSIGLKRVGDAQGDLRLRDVFSRLLTDGPTGESRAGDLLDVGLHVRAHADLEVSIPDADAFLPGGTNARARASATWNDLTKLSGTDGPQLDTSGLSQIFALDFKPGSPAELFGIVLKTLQTLSAQLAEANPGGAYDTQIPGIGLSLRDLMRRDVSGEGSHVTYGANTLTDTGRTFPASFIGRSVVVGTQVAVVTATDGQHTITVAPKWVSLPATGAAYSFRSALDDAVDLMSAHPPQNMQDLVTFLNQRLGSGALGLRYLDDNGTPSIVLDLDWKRSYATTPSVRLKLDGAPALSASTSGEGKVAVTGGVKVGVVVPLQAGDGPVGPSDLKVLADSRVSVAADASFTGSAEGTLGPLTVLAGKAKGTADELAQLRANLSLDLARSAAPADTPMTFTDFFSGIGAQFNTSNTPVTCGEALQTDLMACASIPLYAVVAGGIPTSLGTASLRLPQSTNAADLGNLVGNLPAPDSTKARLEAPSGLAAALTNAIADFTQVGPGLDGYLEKIEQGMRLATLDGSLPFVGKDLQQGADSIGKLRGHLKAKLGDIPANPAEAKAYLNTQLKAAIAAAGLKDTDLTVDYECLARLDPTGKPTVTPTVKATGTGDGSTTWTYQIVASQGDGNGATDDTLASDDGATTAGAATLGADDYNTLTWTSVEQAKKYKILRKAGADYELIGVIDAKAGGTQTFVDTGQAGSAYTKATEKPILLDCPPDGIDGINLAVTVAVGQVDQNQGCIPGSGCLGDGAKRPLDIGIPGLALRAGENDAITYGLGMQLHLKAGISRQKGFVVYTHDAWQEGKAAPELGIGARFDMPASMQAELAFLDIGVTKKGTDPLFAGAFFVDLKSGDDESPESVLTLDDLTNGDLGSIFDVSLKASIKADWDVVASADSVLPGVGANFVLDWGIDTTKPNASLGAPTIAFNHVRIDAGSFFSELLGPVLAKVKSVTGPIQPVIDTLYAPIPVLSDLSKLAGGSDVSLMTLGKTFNTLAGGPDLTFVERTTALVKLVNNLPTCSTSCSIDVGSFTVSGEKALATSVSPTSASSLVIPTGTPKSGDALKGELNRAAGKTGSDKVFGSEKDKGSANTSGFTFPILDDPSSVFGLLMGSDVSIVEFDSGPLTLGFTWRQSFGPVYAPPPVVVTLAGSASVSLRIMAGLDTAGIRYAVEAARSGSKIDPVALLDGLYFKTTDKNGKPVPVVQLDGEIAAGAAVSALILTVGIEGGLHLAVGFYWNDPNNDGKFRVSEFLQAAINNPLCLFTTTGRLSLFLRLYITIGFSPFSTTFKVTLADLTLLDFTAKADCEPPPPRLAGTDGDTLVVFAGKFGTDDQRGKTWGNTADTKADVVRVTSLHFAQTKDDPDGTNPDFDGFRVQLLGETRDYLDPNLKRVVVDGRDSQTPLVVTFIGDGKKDADPTSSTSPADLSTFEKDAIVIGTNKGDQIQMGTGNSWVDGRGGNDRIVTGDTKGHVARVTGGDGSDQITTGAGNNFVSGDGSLSAQDGPSITAALAKEDRRGGVNSVKLTGVVDWTKLAADPTTGDQSGTGTDVISVGLGSNRVNGGAGDDKISVASDLPDGSAKSAGNVLIGGLGSDSIAGGSGADTIYASSEDSFGPDDAGPADTLTQIDGIAQPNLIETGSGDDVAYGSAVEDIITSHSGNGERARIFGGGGSDALVGGYGRDEIFGGPGDDYVIAEPSKVGALGSRSATAEEADDGSFGRTRSVEHLPLPARTTSSAKLLVGGTGNDHILGGDGPSTIFGDTLRDAATVGGTADETCRPGKPVASDPVPEGTSGPAKGGTDGRDLIIGGAGVDTISAGGGDDRVRAGGSGDFVCGQEGNDVLFGDDGGDRLWGGSGADTIFGGPGADYLFGNDGADHLYGQDGPDVIEGNNGADWASGGAGDDIVYGGTRAAGREDIGTAPDSPDTGDVLNGDSGNDILIGDNGTVDDPLNPNDPPAIPLDLDGKTPKAGRGDTIFGGDGNDTAYGGLGDDRIFGGNGDDHLEGNNGADVIHGDAGEDEIIGGSFEQAAPGIGRPDSGDQLYGGDGADLIVGDNAIVRSGVPAEDTTPVTRMRGFALHHQVVLLDLGDSPDPNTSGDDEIFGGDGDDVIFGQGGKDRIKAGSGDDYAEGGPGIDWVEGNAGDDDLVGGSSTPASGSGETTTGQPDSADALWGGTGDDVILGDNGQILRPEPGQTPTRSTVRLGSQPGTAMTVRVIQPWDRNVGGSYLTTPATSRFGGDQISGGDGVDVLEGQDGDDVITGDGGADYIEGNGGSDRIFGDLPFGITSTHGTRVELLTADWPGSPSGRALLVGTDPTPGQDDLIGGTPTPGFRDGADTIEGNDGDDVILGDNGSLVRTLTGAPGAQSEKVYTDRYPKGAVPADATVSRTHDPALPGPATRFCTTAQATCEVRGAFGDDVLHGDAGNDGIWGQDGDDVIHGGAGDDDLFGELGDDRIFGDAGRDVILGDRGGVVNRYLGDGVLPAQATITLQSPPKESFVAFPRGAYDRRVDLLHDVDGDQWIGGPTAPPMPHPGLTEGGRDLIRGGSGDDHIHAGFGNDVANGDSGADVVFGDDGEDVLWGGFGCDPVLDATASDCQTNGVFDPASRGDGDRFVDHIFGGAGESDPKKQNLLGSDILDLRPRGSYEPGVGCTLGDWPVTTGTKKSTVTIDPCLWFEMTDMDDADPSNDNHHQGVDWIYGGWDRDVMQGDVTANGPNGGDRLIDWNGAYNLFSHCNAAYGGWNDIRQHSPAMQSFLQNLAWAGGAGQTAADVTTPGTSAFRELALVYPSDNGAHGAGQAYPGTPGHFDEAACM